MRIVEEFADGWVHIEYESEDGETIESFCLRWDLSLPDPAPGEEPLRASIFQDAAAPRAQ